MSVFNILGPVMIGPSSSHTAGAVNIGRTARQLLGKTPREVEVVLYGSFASTYRGHGTDRAIIGGILGFATDDHRIKDALEIADKEGLEYRIYEDEADRLRHPNTARVKLKSNEEKCEVVGISIGGGQIKIIELDNFKVNISGLYDALICVYPDQLGIVSNVSRVLAMEGINIAFMSVFRDNKSDNCLMVVEVDGELCDRAVAVVDDLSFFYSVRSMRKIDV